MTTKELSMNDARQGKTILIVEDSQTQALQLQNLLMQHGYGVVAAKNGREGLASIRSIMPSLVITDIVMPDMDGYQLCTTIRADEAISDIPVILLTQLSTVKDIILALECGADNFITKPYKEEHLLSKIETILTLTNHSDKNRTVVESSISYKGDDYPISSEIPRILDLLISTYELSLIKNQEQQNTLRERMQAEEALRESEERFRNILEFAPIGMAVVSFEGNFIMVNRALCEIVGYEKEELEKMTFQEITHPDDLEANIAKVQLLLNGSVNFFQMEKRYIRKDQQPVWVQFTVSLQRDSSESPHYFITQIENISERKRNQDQIHRLAYYDALTNLPNRRLLKDRLNQALAQAKRFDRSMALMFLDLDNFKLVNDSLGHDAGDELLKIIADRLLACLRGVDTICRQGGDEFIIVLAEITHPQDAKLVAEKIIKAINTPIYIQETDLHVTMSIGIAVYPVNGADDAKALMKKADTAMYETKNNGRNGFTIYQLS
jgi:diguanylate cyclase (GGDEF)-like protein/PAS domain S-box-containing protein